jgi:hypothetical protein
MYINPLFSKTHFIDFNVISFNIDGIEQENDEVEIK